MIRMADRNRLRKKQDKILARIDKARGEAGYVPGENMGVSGPNSPTIAELRTKIYPEWEWLFDRLNAPFKK